MRDKVCRSALWWCAAGGLNFEVKSYDESISVREIEVEAIGLLKGGDTRLSATIGVEAAGHFYFFFSQHF
ncbi:unnamed protein product [Rhodiola kirilowii]